MIAPRWYLLGLVACLSLLSVAYFYFEKTLGLAPCPLCMFQRACLAGVAVVCLFGLIIRPKALLAKVFAFLSMMFSLLGLAIASRQVWLQNLPAHLVPECGPDLEYMLGAFPLSKVIQNVLQGSGECAEVQWQFLTLSMPTWMVIVFAVMVLVSLKMLFLRERRYFNKPYVDS